MKRIILGLILMLAVADQPTAAQQTSLDSAIAFVNQGKSDLALPILERLAANDPKNVTVHERLGLSLLKVSGSSTDAEARRLQRVRARAAFEAAVRLGSKNAQINALLAAIPPDGGKDATFSSSPEVDEAMQSAERAYSSGDYRAAFTFYQKALSLNPGLYEAALFSGDTYVHTESVDSAYIWYARATEINPDKETAWRYWSDVLLKHDRLDEARDKAVQAMIAEPYNRVSQSVLAAWAGKSKEALSFPRIALPAGTAAQPSTAARAAYDSVRLAWKGPANKGGAAFTSAFPTESTYRHSVAEERAALLAAYAQDPANTGTANVKKMHDAGVLEAFIFFAAADEGIASEYQEYRRNSRDALQKFWLSFVIGAPYAK